MPPSIASITPQKALAASRIIWGALVMGLVFIGTVTLFTLKNNSRPADHLEYIFAGIVWSMLLIGVPIGLFIRGQIFKRHWVGSVVTPIGYQTGNIIAWAICEGISMNAVVFCQIVGRSWLVLSAGIAGLVMLLLLFPNGKAMFPPENFNPYQQQR